MEIRSVTQNKYDQLTYAGLVNRIRDGVSLSEHQKLTIARCGLTVEDFRNQKTEQEKIDLINRLRAEG